MVAVEDVLMLMLYVHKRQMKRHAGVDLDTRNRTTNAVGREISIDVEHKTHYFLCFRKKFTQSSIDHLPELGRYDDS